MATSGARRRPQKYPEELRERAVRMVLEVRRETGEKQGTVTRIATQLGIGAESLRGWVNQAEVDAGRGPGTSSWDGQRIAEFEREVRELRRANDMWCPLDTELGTSSILIELPDITTPAIVHAHALAAVAAT